MRPFRTTSRTCWPLLAAGLLVSTTAWASCTSFLSAGVCNATVSATALHFGNYDPNSSIARDVTSTVTVTATMTGAALSSTTIGYTVNLGTGMTGSINARRMTGGSGAGPSLGYNLYTTTNHDTVWGTNGVSDSITSTTSERGTPLSRSYTVYGRVPAAQYVSSGSNYVDTIIVTVTY